MTRFKLIFLCLISLTLILFFISLYHYTKKRNEYKRTIDARKAFIAKLNSCSEEKELLNELANRSYTMYYSYALHTMMCMLCNIYSLLYSIVSFAYSFSSEPYSESYLVSFLAFFFIAVTIYIAPHKRSTQFLKAWRKLNNELLLALYGGENKPDTTHIIDVMNKTEESLTADEDNS